MRWFVVGAAFGCVITALTVLIIMNWDRKVYQGLLVPCRNGTELILRYPVEVET